MEKSFNSVFLKEKIAQMFIMGFSGTIPDKNILKVIKMGLGGVIFFAENITSHLQMQKLTNDLNKYAQIPLFTSIDQEGGLVERTINLENKLEYLTPRALSSSNDLACILQHTKIMVQDLKTLHINMNFAPVLDVNTNKNNPIIGVRSFYETTDKVIQFSEPVYKTHNENNIIAVGKHFPGHGEAWCDSHLEMPFIDMKLDELEEIHIKPFKQAIKKGLDAVMIAHAHYGAFNHEKIPASLSKELITDYLKGELDFKGLIISDDMVMGGITKHYNHHEACIKAINAGIDILIFRDSTEQNIELIDKLYESVKTGLIPESRINESFEKIIFFKSKFKILNNSRNDEHINIKNYNNIADQQEKIDKIALKTIKTSKKGKLIPLNKNSKILILSPDKSQIFNYSKDKGRLSDFLNIKSCSEISYSLNPDEEEIMNILNFCQQNKIVIFISYNALLNSGQFRLFENIDNPLISIVAGNPYDAEKFNKADSILLSYCYKTPSLWALSKILNHPIAERHGGRSIQNE